MGKRTEAVSAVRRADRIAWVEILHNAEERVRDANLRVTVEHVFFGAFAHGLKVRFSTKIPTAATNGKSVIFNPYFIAKLTRGALYGLVLHEIAHVALGHQLRRGNRDAAGWNVAADYSINQILTDAGITLPDGALLNGKFKGWSAEHIYQYLQRKGGPTPQETQQAQQGEVRDAPTQEGAEKKKAEGGSKPKDGEKGKPGKAEGAKQDGKPEQAQAGDEEAGNGPKGTSDEESTPGGKGGTDKSDDDSKGAGAGADDDDDDDDDTDYTADPEDGAEDEDPFEDDWTADSNDDVERSDDFELPTEADARTEWTLKTTQAEMLARGSGKLPGSLEQELAEAKKTTSPWVALLADALTEVAQDDYTYGKLNRYYNQGGALMPGMHSESIGPLVIGVDTSGSTFNAETMAKVAGEMDSILSAFNFPEIHVVSWDTRVTDVQVLAAGEPLEFSPKGGGGTDVNALFNYVEENGLTPAAIVVLTDLDFWRYPSTEPTCKLIWGAVKSNRRLMEQVPFGTVINIEDYTE